MASVTLASPSVKLNSNHMYTSFAFHHSSDDPTAESFAAHLNLMRKSFLPELGDSEPDHTSLRIKLGRKRIDNCELDVFDAEKYFSGVMDPADETASEQSTRFSHKKEGEGSVMSKSKSKSKSGSESTWSETTSANSQSILLRHRRKCSPAVERRQASGKRFLGVFRCSCSGKDGIDVEKHAGEETGLSNGQKISYVDEIDGRNPMEYWRERQAVWHRREAAVALPADSNLAGGKVAVGREAHEREIVETPVGVFGIGPLSMGKHETNSSFRRSLNLLSSSTPAAAAGGGGDGDDIASEASSDLFEIESLSINGHPSFQPDVSYEPSEASIEWSVVTASAANFSVASENIDDIAAVRDIHDAKKLSKQRRPSLLMGCVSQNAVDVDKPERRQEIPTATPAKCYTDGSYKMDFEPVRSQRALAVSHARSMR